MRVVILSPCTRVNEAGPSVSRFHEGVNLNAHISNDIFGYAMREERNTKFLDVHRIQLYAYVQRKLMISYVEISEPFEMLDHYWFSTLIHIFYPGNSISHVKLQSNAFFSGSKLNPNMYICHGGKFFKFYFRVQLYK